MRRRQWKLLEIRPFQDGVVENRTSEKDFIEHGICREGVGEHILPETVKEEGVGHRSAARPWRVEVVLQRTLLSLARRESKSAAGNGNAGRAAES